jgi:hypothetical protein
VARPIVPFSTGTSRTGSPTVTLAHFSLNNFVSFDIFGHFWTFLTYFFDIFPIFYIFRCFYFFDIFGHFGAVVQPIFLIFFDIFGCFETCFNIFANWELRHIQPLLAIIFKQFGHFRTFLSIWILDIFDQIWTFLDWIAQMWRMRHFEAFGHF